ncbi:hypothetical protein [Actinopolymorpha pittospori]|uniref:Uncharacterized protein n=1 Tax=Actinopolymorpha pittospori TaxID=648752 RepID=A0A927MXZ1_9ACTN|nr:hypothetical protein [Actinopolymorpha pittospori]MBE1608561.1 hypothetical protein [Actinopolymorpha pittospori]
MNSAFDTRDRTKPRLVMLSGSCAGIGKSTLAEGLTRRLEEAGATVDLFGEHQIFARADFVDVAEAFRSREFPTPELFLPTYARVFDGFRAANAWGVFDWHCAGMAADLPWAMRDHGRLARLCLDVRELAEDMDPVLLDLAGDVRTATERALAQRGDVWAKRYARLASDAGHTSGRIAERIVAWSRDQLGALREQELAAMRSAGWPVIELDATASAAEVLEQAWDALGLGRSTALPSPCVTG